MKNILYSIPLLILLGCHSCDKEPKPTYIYLSQEIKDWMYFKKGTYWIYRDAPTGKEDSVWVDTAYIEMKDYGYSRNSPDYRIEERFYVLQKTTFDDYIYIYISLMNSGPNYPNNISYPNTATVVMEANTSDLKYRWRTDVLYLPSIVGANGALIKVHDSIEVAGKYYKNVAQYGEGRFVCKHFGNIRIAGRLPYFEGTNYKKDLQLVRYKIVQ